MLTFILKVIGRALACAPEPLLRALAAGLGDTLFWLEPRRRRLILSNLSHAFPGRSPAWRRRIGRTSLRRLVETGMLSLATPYLGERRIRRIAVLAPSLESWIRVRSESGDARAVVLCGVHLALLETPTWMLYLSPGAVPEMGAIFRPLDAPAADAHVKRTRERFGVRMLSRKEGFVEALGILRRGGAVGFLFDQNAGLQGALTLLFDRVCSTTDLPGLLAVKTRADVRTLYPRRTGFWRVALESDAIAHDGTSQGITSALNRWLESILGDEGHCSSWLWAHDRWRHQDWPPRRFRLESKRNILADDLRARGLPALPRRTRLWIRLPNWLGDVMMTVPLLRALRAGRPDAEITLLADRRFLPLIASFGVADALRPLPPKGPGYFASFVAARREYPDVWLLFTNSARGDLEARLAGCPQRFGIARAGRRRPLLSHAYAVPPDFDESRRHQVELWEAFLRHFGLLAPLDRTPLAGPPGEGTAERESARIGLIPGSENNPAKRWPVERWRELIAAMPESRFSVFGTAGDAPIAAAIAAGHDAGRVEDLAGRTDLAGFAARLRSCRLLVANDSGGMHLANALGVPVVALFGPTNPVRTGPVFDAPVRILQPPGCPPTGGAPLTSLTPDSVAAAIRALQAAPVR